MQSRTKTTKVASLDVGAYRAPTGNSKANQTYLQVKKRLGLFNANLQDGDTKLHVLMRHKITIQEFRAYMVHVGEDKAMMLAKTVNGLGFLPIQEIALTVTGKRCKRHQKINDRVLELTRVDTLLPKDQLIDERDVLAPYPASIANLFLRANLRFATLVANRVRKLGLRSDTMPCHEGLSEREQIKISDTLNRLRDRHPDFVPESLGEGKKFAFFHYRALHLTNHSYRRHQVGNCAEYAKQAMEFFREEDKNLRVEAMSVENGDHVFVVIDRDYGTEEYDYDNWGDSAVVCDPWSGAVFPASEIPERLGNHRNLYYEPNDECYTVITKFSPAFHDIEKEYELPKLGA